LIQGGLTQIGLLTAATFEAIRNLAKLRIIMATYVLLKQNPVLKKKDIKEANNVRAF
jgi:hypothetical protein